MSKTLKLLLILAFAGVVIGGSVIYYVFNKPHRNIENEAPAFTMSAADLYSEFSSNEESGNTKFGNQIIQVNGEIVDISKNGVEVSIMLLDEMEGVSCAMDSSAVVNNSDLIKGLEIGTNITLKGKCDGYDMIMGVVLTKCFFVEE